MSSHTSFHVHGETGETLHIDSQVQHIENRPSMKSAFIKLKVGSDTVTIYFDSLRDIENLAFHAQTLVMHAREEWIENEEDIKG